MEDKKKSEIENLKKDLERINKKAEEYLNGWKRAKADYINFKRESEKKQKEIIQFAQAGLLLELFPLMDQFKRAFNHLPDDLKKSDWLEGIRHIQNNLKKILAEAGIKEIKTVGEKFNPEFHEAVERVESDKPSGTIVMETQTGFTLHDKVIIPARVKVAK